MGGYVGACLADLDESRYSTGVSRWPCQVVALAVFLAAFWVVGNASASDWHRVVLPATPTPRHWKEPATAEGTIKAYVGGRAVPDKETSDCTGLWNGRGVLGVVNWCGATYQFRVRYTSPNPVVVLWRTY
jgi:hypothetical protein